MPRATNQSTMSAVTRGNPADAGAVLLGLGGGAAVAAAAQSPDAELLACIALANAIDVRTAAGCDAVDHLSSSDPRWEAAYQQSWREMPTFHAMVKRAADLPARTPEGLKAKAELVLSYLRTGDNDADIALSLARDVVGRV